MQPAVVPSEPASAGQFIEGPIHSAEGREARDGEEHETEQRYRALFELGPVAVYSIDPSGVIQHFNRRAVELWGREPAPGATDEKWCGSYRLFRSDGTFMPHHQTPMADVVSGKVRR